MSRTASRPKLSVGQRVWRRTVDAFILSLGLASALIFVVTTVPAGERISEIRFQSIIEARGLSDTKMVLTDDPERNCGGYRGGCFQSDTPDTIYVSPSVKLYYLDYVIIHELGHLIDYANGTMSDDSAVTECAADQYAKDAGAWTVRLSPYECDLN